MTFDPFESFAEVERLVGKVYFRFSHLFLNHPELRDFWWEMGVQEEQHGAILLACKEMIGAFEDESVDPAIGPEKADELKARIKGYLSRGTREIAVEDAFRMALAIESSEIDVIYGKLLHLGGPEAVRILENLGVPASVQRQRLKIAAHRFCKDPKLLEAAESL